MSLKNFFNPAMIAVLGASQNPQKVGRQILDNIILSGYQGSIYAINLKEKNIASLPTFSDISNLPVKNWSELLVVIAIPAAAVLLEVEKCGRLGIKNIIIISAGFKETDDEGKNREEKLKELIKKYNLNLLGPNCLGFINNFYHFNASFSHRANLHSRIALISQSGAIGSSILDWLKRQNLGLGYFISLGNKAGLNENHFLDYFSKDKNVEVVFLYLEEIAAGKEFMELVSKIAPHKTVIVLKAGMSEQGQALAKSHTGALAGETAIIKAALERSGAILINDLSDLFNLLILMRSSLSLKNKLSDKLQIITNAGGLAVLAADSANLSELNLINNLDLLGTASPEDYELALKKSLASDKEVNILVLLSPQLATKPEGVAKVILEAAQKNPKRLILTSFLGGKTIEGAREYLINNGLPFFSYPEQALRALGLLVKQSKKLNKFVPFNFSWDENNAFKEEIINYDYLSLFTLLKKYKINSLKTNIYNFQENEKFFYPVVLKAVGPDFIHKTDKGVVVLNIQNDFDLKEEATKIKQANLDKFKNNDNYLVIQPQIKDKLELILGFKRDPSFGPVLLFGLGGIYAEILKTVRLTIADLDEKRALEFIHEAPFFPILDGARGGVKYDLNKLAKVLVSFSQLANQEKEIKEFDINPLFLTDQDIFVGDVRAF